MSRESGFAMPGILILMVIVTVTAAGSLAVTGRERAVSDAVRERTRAFYAAEAGIHSVISKWPEKRYDTLLAASGDSVETSWGSLANGCGHRVTIRRVDDGSGPGLWHLRSLGISPGPQGGQRSVVSLMVHQPEVVPRMALSTGDDIEITGSPTFLGACADIHANDDVALDADETLTTAGDVSATDDVYSGGTFQDTAGSTIYPTSGADSVTLTEIDPLDYCGEADTYLRNGWLVRLDESPVDSTYLGSNSSEGWSWSSGNDKYTLDGDQAGAGTVCTDGGIDVKNTPGADGYPLELTLLADGRINFSGNAFIEPAHSLGILAGSDGDVKLSGNSGSTSPNYQGLVYAGSQCWLNGHLTVEGRIICKDEPSPSGYENLLDRSLIDGDATLTYDCSKNYLPGVSRIALRPWTRAGS